MCKTDKAANAGVHDSNGIEFQKNCALLFIIEDYENLKNEDYFVCIEHHDDILFCYRNKDSNISSIDSYQAKKSSSEWGMSEGLFDIIRKMTIVGENLSKEAFDKSVDYAHKLHFVTNNSIKLNNGKSKSDRKTCLINESNSSVQFDILDKEIRDQIISKIEESGFKSKDELKNVYLTYIDFPKTNAKQLSVLVGRCEELLGNRISDPKAVVHTLLKIFRKVENTLNQGNKIKLLDKSKRVESKEIADAMSIVTKQKMAYDLWHEKADTICEDLDLCIHDQKSFVSNFQNNFDLFKDLSQGEHQRILKFVDDNMNVTKRFRKHTDCVKYLCDLFFNTYDSSLSENEIKAAVYAAYIELGDIGEN